MRFRRRLKAWRLSAPLAPRSAYHLAGEIMVRGSCAPAVVTP
jgi:hypothetical protein